MATTNEEQNGFTDDDAYSTNQPAGADAAETVGQTGKYNFSRNNTSGMQSLIQTVNRLQDVFTKAGLSMSMDLPQIVVVGSQSSGKSSVLESFVGRDFLPRGAGIVTRRPLILQMVHDFTAEYGVFAHDHTRRKYTDFAAIRREIEAETARVAPGKLVSPQPINLLIHSPEVLNLTLVDLPGLTQVAMVDQPPDIERKILDIVRQYISHDNALILAVSPANSDLANSVALRVAKNVDPEGQRTISVITKLDLMEDGSDARPTLTNQIMPLKLGHIGVVNRSQTQIDKGENIEVARKKEREFFQNHPAYHDIARQCGSTHLQVVLNAQLSLHIRDHLPKLRETLRQQIANLEPEVRECRKFTTGNARSMSAEKSKDLIAIVNQLAEAFEKSIRAGGGVFGENDNRLINRLEQGCGARIKVILNSVFRKNMLALDSGNVDQVKNNIKIIIRNLYGVETGLFVPQQAFDEVAREFIIQMRKPSEKCVDMVVSELNNNFTAQLGEPLNDVVRYPALHSEITHMFASHLDERQTFTIAHINQFIDCHLAYMNPNHDDFLKTKIEVVNIALGNRASAAGENVSNPKVPAPTVAAAAAVPAPKAARKGPLTVMQKVGDTGTYKKMRKYWFVLDNDMLTCYTDDTEQERKYSIPLTRDSASRCRLLSGTSGDDGPNFFTFRFSDNNELRTLYLSGESAEDAQAWQVALASTGVVWENRPEAAAVDAVATAVGESADENLTRAETASLASTEDDNDNDEGDSSMNEHVDIIYKMVQSYVPIINGVVRDFVPKSIVHLLVNDLIGYLKTKLLGDLQAIEKGADTPAAVALMEEPFAVVERRKRVIGMYDATKDALRIIAETALPVAPAVGDD